MGADARPPAGCICPWAWQRLQWPALCACLTPSRDEKAGGLLHFPTPNPNLKHPACPPRTFEKALNTAVLSACSMSPCSLSSGTAPSSAPPAAAFHRSPSRWWWNSTPSQLDTNTTICMGGRGGGAPATRRGRGPHAQLFGCLAWLGGAAVHACRTAPSRQPSRVCADVGLLPPSRPPACPERQGAKERMPHTLVPPGRRRDVRDRSSAASVISRSLAPTSSHIWPREGVDAGRAGHAHAARMSAQV